MKTLSLLFTLVITFCANGQDLPRKVYINSSIGFIRLTTDKNFINNSPLMIEGKIGKYIRKNHGIGLQFSSAFQSIPTSGQSSIQQPGSGVIWTRFGTRRQKMVAFGLFYERFLSLGKRITFFPSIYAQYLNYKDVEKGNIVAGSDSSMTYEREILYRYFGRVGLNMNIEYAISTCTTITLRLAQVDCRLWNKYERNLLIELPFLLGFKYRIK